MNGSLRVLIVEDNEDDMELLLRELRRGGYDPVYCRVETREEMLDALEKETWNIIFSDYSLPKFSGMTALEIYREKGLDIPFVILSGTIGEGTAVAAMKAGASDYLMKNNLARLVPALERELREAEIRREHKWAQTVQSALYIISKGANTNLPLDSFYRLIHAILDELMPAENFYVAIYDAEIDLLSFPYHKDRYDAQPEPRRTRRGLTEYIIRTGKSILVTPDKFDELVAKGEAETVGTPSVDWMGAALKQDDQPIGALVVQTYDENVRYGEKELAILDFIADQVELLLQRKLAEEKIRQANQRLSLAYDSTLEGWSRALELRERETAGHSQRVVHLTLKIARALGMQEEQLVHVRRGALLHDIGKMGIPDQILLKPDRLNEEEWVIMRQHPVYSYKLLAPIEYLRPALDIPYCHHERWDGAGYPRGLKGEEIPLAARIFAVVDVWDALLSERPYSSAWTKEAAREYILSQAGKHFDPQIVDVFLLCLEDEE